MRARGLLLFALLLSGCFPDLTGAPCSSDQNCPSGQYCSAGAKCIPGATPQVTLKMTDLPRGQVGRPYEASLEAGGGAPPYSFALEGAGGLPPDVQLSMLGRLEGTPKAGGTFSFRVQVSDQRRRVGSRDFVLSVDASPAALEAVTSTLSAGFQGRMYSAVLNARGGTPPYAWSLVSGALPGGIALAAGGSLAGIPGAAGSFTFEAQVRDSAGSFASRSLTLVISPAMTAPLKFATTALPDAVVGVAYSTSLSATGGVPGYRFTSLADLPSGFSLDPNGTLSGVPRATGTLTLHLRVTDGADQSVDQQLSISVAGAAGSVTVVTQSLPPAFIGRTYDAVLSAARGSPPYTWSVVQGTLPPGVSLARSSGALHGTPNQPGSFPFLVRATETATPAASAERLLTIQVVTPVVLETGSLPAAVAGQPYSGALSASGGTQPYAWSIVDGSLPVGLALDPRSGMISGTTTSTGARSIRFGVADSGSPMQSVERVIGLTVLSAQATTLDIGPSALPDAVSGAAYSVTLSASGGTAPYTYQVAGTLPAWLSLASGGVLRGTPSTSDAGDFALTIRAQDSAVSPAVGLKAIVLHVRPALSFLAQALPGGDVGWQYSSLLPIAGGTPPYSIAISAGSTLPSGLSLNTASGEISGTPGQAGGFSFSVGVHDSGSPPQTATGRISIAINPRLELPALAIPDGVTQRGYAATLQASGGTPPYAFSAVGLPSTMGISALGVLSGAPPQAGSITFMVQVQDSRTAIAMRQFTLVVSDPLSISTSASLPDGVSGGAYQASLAAAGGAPSLRWDLVQGPLPAGLSLSPSGALSGTLMMSGTSSFTLRVTDGSNPPQTDQRTFTLSVASPLALLTTTLPGGVQTTAYDAPISAGGGTPPYSFSTTGTLPSGLTLDPSTGHVSGTPMVYGASTFPVTVNDSGAPPQSASGMVSISIAPPPPSITTVTLPDGIAGSSYSTSLAASGGVAPLSWSIVSGALPQGVMLNSSTAEIHGVPATAGSYAFTIQVQDSSIPPQTGTRPLMLRVVNPLLITNGALPPGQTNLAYTAPLTASGGTGPYTWQIVGGALPGGVNLDSTGAQLFGNPAQPGTFMFTVQVTDSGAPALSTTMPFTVAISSPAPGALQITTPSTLPAASGRRYQRTLNASGGTSPYTWSIDAGALPSGFTMDASGNISSSSGSMSGDYWFRVVVTDSSLAASSASKWFLLHIRG